MLWTACVSAETLKKNNGTFEMGPMNSNSEFTISINTNEDGSACMIDGKAVMVDEHRAAFTPEDSDSQCVLLIDFSDKTQATVKATSQCNEYCGLAARGTLSGIYK